MLRTAAATQGLCILLVVMQLAAVSLSRKPVACSSGYLRLLHSLFLNGWRSAFEIGDIPRTHVKNMAALHSGKALDKG